MVNALQSSSHFTGTLHAQVRKGGEAHLLCVGLRTGFVH